MRIRRTHGGSLGFFLGTIVNAIAVAAMLLLLVCVWRL